VHSAVELLPDAAEALRSLTLDAAPVQAFSAIVAGSFADWHDLPVLDLLEGDSPVPPRRRRSAFANSQIEQYTYTFDPASNRTRKEHVDSSAPRRRATGRVSTTKGA
jgi:hypothetical protein